MSARRAALCLPLLLLWAAAPARGQGLYLRPFLEVEETFEDNILFTSEDPISDFYTRFQPGASIHIPTPWLDLDLEYSYLTFWYAENSKYNRDFHLFRAKIDEEPIRFRNLTVGVGDDYDVVPENIGIPRETPNNLIQRNRAWIRPVWRKRFSERTYADVGYQLSRVDYQGDRGENYFGHRFFTDVGRALSPRFRLFQQNEFLVRQFDDIDDIWSFVPSLGFDAEPVNRLRVQVRGGYQVLYEMEGAHSGYIADARALYTLSSRLELEGRLRRRFTLDVNADTYIEDSALLEAKYALGPRVTLSGLVGYSRWETQGGEDTTDFFSLGAHLDWRLARRLYWRIGYTHYNNPGSDGYTANRAYTGFRYAY